VFILRFAQGIPHDQPGLKRIEHRCLKSKSLRGAGLAGKYGRRLMPAVQDILFGNPEIETFDEAFVAEKVS
jgi:hypothetical protein